MNHPESPPAPSPTSVEKVSAPKLVPGAPRAGAGSPRDPLGLALPRRTTHYRFICAVVRQSLTPAFPFLNFDFGDPRATALAPQALCSCAVRETQAWQSEANVSINYSDSRIYSRSGSILKGERLEPVTLTRLCHPDSRK